MIELIPADKSESGKHEVIKTDGTVLKFSCPDTARLAYRHEQAKEQAANVSPSTAVLAEVNKAIHEASTKPRKIEKKLKPPKPATAQQSQATDEEIKAGRVKPIYV